MSDLITEEKKDVGCQQSNASPERQSGHQPSPGRTAAVASQCENLVIVCGVFIHWDAADDTKIYQYNYEATKLSIERARQALMVIKVAVKKLRAGEDPLANLTPR